MFNGKLATAHNQQIKGRSRLIRVQPAAWRRLSTWADRSGSEAGMATDVVLVSMLLCGTVLCFGLQGARASYRAWRGWGSSRTRLTDGNQTMGRQAIQTTPATRNGSAPVTTAW